MRSGLVIATVLLVSPLTRAATFVAAIQFADSDGANNTSAVSATASANPDGESAFAQSSADSLRAVSTAAGSTAGQGSNSAASFSTGDLVLSTSPAVTTVDTALNLVLNGTLAVHSQVGSGAVSSVEIDVNIADSITSRYFLELDSNDGTTYVNGGDSNTLTPSSSTDDTATFTDVPVSIELDGVPTNMPVDFSVSLISSSLYRGDGQTAGTPADASASFGDTLQFASSNVFTDLDSTTDPLFTADAPDVGIVANTSAPEPVALMAAAPALLCLLTTRRRRSQSR